MAEGDHVACVGRQFWQRLIILSEGLDEAADCLHDLRWHLLGFDRNALDSHIGGAQER